MSTYKGFEINTNTTPAPWGTREQAMVQDVIDTLTVGTVTAAKDTVNGHKHMTLESATASTMVNCSSGACAIGATTTINGSLRVGDATTPSYPLEVKLTTADFKLSDLMVNVSAPTSSTTAKGKITINVGTTNYYIPIYGSVSTT
jgi:hypothetical protein